MQETQLLSKLSLSPHIALNESYANELLNVHRYCQYVVVGSRFSGKSALINLLSGLNLESNASPYSTKQFVPHPLFVTAQFSRSLVQFVEVQDCYFDLYFDMCQLKNMSIIYAQNILQPLNFNFLNYLRPKLKCVIFTLADAWFEENGAAELQSNLSRLETLQVQVFLSSAALRLAVPVRFYQELGDFYAQVRRGNLNIKTELEYIGGRIRANFGFSQLFYVKYLEYLDQFQDYLQDQEAENQEGGAEFCYLVRQQDQVCVCEVARNGDQLPLVSNAFLNINNDQNIELARCRVAPFQDFTPQLLNPNQNLKLFHVFATFAADSESQQDFIAKFCNIYQQICTFIRYGANQYSILSVDFDSLNFVNQFLRLDFVEIGPIIGLSTARRSGIIQDFVVQGAELKIIVEPNVNLSGFDESRVVYQNCNKLVVIDHSSKSSDYLEGLVEIIEWFPLKLMELAFRVIKSAPSGGKCEAQETISDLFQILEEAQVVVLEPCFVFVVRARESLFDRQIWRLLQTCLRVEIIGQELSDQVANLEIAVPVIDASGAEFALAKALDFDALIVRKPEVVYRKQIAEGWKRPRDFELLPRAAQVHGRRWWREEVISRQQPIGDFLYEQAKRQ